LIPSDYNAVLEDEDERNIDLLDVLLQTHPRNEEPEIDNFDGLVTRDGPYRDSFRYVLPNLPRHKHSLGQLKIGLHDWREFLRLLLISSFPVYKTHLELVFHQASVLTDVLDAMTSSMCVEGQDGISWDAFDNVISRCMVRSSFLEIMYMTDTL
jgi:hypothetical protein